MEKKCLVCEKPLIKIKNESNARFAKKKFCSPEHSRKWMKENKQGWYNRERKDELFIQYPLDNEPLI